MIYISQALLNQVIEQAKLELPNEACGILAGSLLRRIRSNTLSDALRAGEQGRVKVVKKVYEMTNTDKSPATFFMDPKEQIQVMKEIRGLGLEMQGIYHSHVASPAYPSAHDVELAFYPEASYIIISLKDKDNPQIRSFKIKEGKITEEEVKIV